MPDINYLNPQINTISQKEQEASIQVSLNGFSFLIKSAKTKEYLLFRNYKFENIQLIDELIRKSEQVVSNDQYLHSNFSKVELTYISQKSTLVPNEFFNTAHLKKYFEFNHNLNELDELHYTPISAINAFNVFSLPNYLTNVFNDAFGAITFKHQASYLINYGHNLASEGITILVGIQSGFFDIAIFDKKRLLLYNSFQHTNTLDFIYFFLYPLSQLKIDASKQNIIVFGDSKQHAHIIQELKLRVNSVSHPCFENNASGLKQLTNNKKLRFYTLF